MSEDKRLNFAVSLGAFLFPAALFLRTINGLFMPWNPYLSALLGVFRGYPLYPVPPQGPLNCWIYGPLPLLAYSPAALLKSPTAALLLADFIGAALFFYPLYRLCRKEGRSLFLWGGLFIIADASLEFSALSHRADPLALAFAALACLQIYRISEKKSIPARSLALAGLFAALAAWTKQTFIPLFLGLGFYLYLSWGKNALYRFASYSLAWAVSLSALIAGLFGPRALWLNMVQIPARHPWYERLSGSQTLLSGWRISARITVLASAGLEYAEYAALPIGAALFMLYLRRTIAATPRPPWGAWMKSEPWTIFLIAAASLLPAAILGRVKFGGFPYGHAVSIYFLILGVAAAARPYLNGEAMENKVHARMVKTLLFLSLLLLEAKTLRIFSPKTLRETAHIMSNSHEAAYRYIKAHPGTHFPEYPLSSLQAEGKLYHSSCGLSDYASAGYAIDSEYYRAYTPAAQTLNPAAARLEGDGS